MLQALVTERRALAGARHVDRCARTLITGPGRTFDAQVSLEAVSRRMRAEVVNNVVVTDKRGPLAEARECALSGAQTPTQLLASLPTYAEAKKLVDTLSDHRCPVEHTRIVGTGLHSVEYVTGRLTPGSRFNRTPPVVRGSGFSSDSCWDCSATARTGSPSSSGLGSWDLSGYRASAGSRSV